MSPASSTWEVGGKGEEAVVKALVAEGAHVARIARAGSGANLMYSPSGKPLILPDLLVFYQGQAHWAEVKTKANATYTKLTRRLEYGIPLKRWHHYLLVQELTGIPVYIYFLDLEAQSILYAPINLLVNHGRIYQGDKVEKGGMIFVPKDLLIPLRPST